MNKYDKYDKLFKIIIIGEAGVGKTNLLLRYTKGEFNENSRSTIGVGFGYKILDINDQIIRLQIWDTAGQERFRATPSAYYRGAHAALIVFDVCDKKSFIKLTSENGWFQDLNKYTSLNSTKILIGNKIDNAAAREVTTIEAKAFAEKNGMKYYETSAKIDSGITNMFEELVNIILNESQKQAENPSNNDTIIKSSTNKSKDLPPPLNLTYNEPPPTKCCK